VKVPHIFTNAEYADMPSSHEKCIDADGGIFIILGKLYQLFHLNSKYRY
jgi:hypothetical protein